MAQTLTSLSQVTSPATLTMSNALAANMAALSDLGERDLKALTVIGLIHANYTTFDYRTNHAQLMADARKYLGGMSLINFHGTSYNALLIQAVLAWNVGLGVDGALSTSVNTLLNEGRDLLALPAETLDRLILYLQAILST